MIFVNDKKYACETCIKGHRSSSCQHTERALFEIKKKGRPVTQCDHCRELRKTKQVHVRCSCDSKPDQPTTTPKAPGGKKGSRLPAEAAYPHGLTPGVAGVATSPAPAKQPHQHAVACTCGKGETCHCCVPRKAAKPSGHTPPPVYASGHTPNNPHPPHQHHQHAYAPYARPARLSTDAHSLHLANSNSASNLGLPTNIVPTPGAMYRVGPCACGTTCACPECAHHRQQPHSHQPLPNSQPVQGHGGEPCPVRCQNCFDCAGGLTLFLDPNAYRAPPYDADALSAFSGSDPNGSVQSFESEAQHTGAYTPNGTAGQYSTGAATPQPGFFSPGLVDASGMEVDMDNAEFNAAMAGLDAGIDSANTFSSDPASAWDRPRCGFAVSGERGNGSPGHARVGSEVGSEIGVGSDGGYDLASEYGIGSDDGGSVVGVSATNLSLDFADLNFGGLGVPQQPYPYPDHVSQRFSGEYSHSMHGGRVASTSSQFSNHSNLSLVSSIESASVSLASLGSSHGIASLASSHGIPPSGRVTPGHSGRITPVRGVGVAPHSPQNGKPLPRGYRRILPKVAAMTNHRPFRRFHSQQPSLHAVMESDVGGGSVTSPPPSQVLLQPQMQQQQIQQPRVRKSIRSHLPIVGKHFAPGGRYEPSRLRNYHQQQALVQQALAQQQQQQQQQQQRSQAPHALQAQPASPSPLQYPTFSQAQVQTPSGFSPAEVVVGYGDHHSPGQQLPPEVYVETEDGVIYEEDEPPEMDAYEYGHGYDFGDPSFTDGDQTQAGPSPSGSLFVQQALVQQQQQQLSVSLPVHAQMVAALAHGPVSLSYERPNQPQPQQPQPQPQQSFVPLQPQQQQQQPARPQLSQVPHTSSQSTTMPAPSPIIVIDSAMQSPQMLPDTDPTPPSPRQKISSGIGMPLTMSLPLTNAGTGRVVRTHAYDDADADVKVPVNKDVGSPGGGQGRKSRWPSFSVHGHRVMVGAKVMGAAYATRS